ncbi:hypothetical protein OIDMADRAFT_181273 [Oidiodendron maius Zn]|uniref:Zn(2)-C6 fungal-type domain-containing protein n=1 Tax=Oidiodendron maius (strain Zn) TaxID=913774 RepID=A0A0C3HCE6_OIDMZ|nr:hypothetical protein OIDMADRAFT_181273 [Oidiodendron maius Zn]
MVGLPNRAGRCTICRRIKAKCDLSRPACLRCRRLGLRCEYLVIQQGQIFINRSVTDPFVSAVDIFSNAAKTKLLVNSGLKHTAPSYIYHSESLKHSIPTSPNPAPVHRMQLLSKFLDVYFPIAAQAPTRASQTTCWVYALPNISLTNCAYNTSLEALCVAQIGLWNHDPVLVKESSQLYGSALGELRKTVGGRKLVAPEATLASTVILSTYELFSGQSSQNYSLSHVQGGSQILQILGPSVYETPAGRILCANIRTATIIQAFRSRRRSALPGQEWERCARDHEGHGLYYHLQDLMIQLPSIMEALDMLTTSPNKTTEVPILIRLLHLCSSLNWQLLAWSGKLKTLVHGPLYWTVPSVAVNPADDPVLGRMFPLAFQFPSLIIAWYLLLYWSMLILLYRTIQDIQKRLKSQVTRGITPQHSFDLQDTYRSELDSDNSCPSDDGIASLANNISQSFEYCYRTEHGTLGYQSTLFALWVVQGFYKSQPNRARELAWCSELGNTTASNSRFDLRVMKLSGDG